MSLQFRYCPVNVMAYLMVMVSTKTRYGGVGPGMVGRGLVSDPAGMT